MSQPNARPRSKEISSYYSGQAHWVSRNLTKLESQSLKELLTCFLTIKKFRDFLFDPKVNLVKQINDKFINDIMLVDFGSVIVGLRDYRGPDRRGVKEAYEIMNQAQENLYQAYNAFTKKNAFQKDNAKSHALMACRKELQKAYLHLEHLDRKVKEFYKPR